MASGPRPGMSRYYSFQLCLRNYEKEWAWSVSLLAGARYRARRYSEFFYVAGGLRCFFILLAADQDSLEITSIFWNQTEVFTELVMCVTLMMICNPRQSILTASNVWLPSGFCACSCFQFIHRIQKAPCRPLFWSMSSPCSKLLVLHLAGWNAQPVPIRAQETFRSVGVDYPINLYKFLFDVLAL